MIPATFVGWRWGTGNVGAVVPGRVYRSAQLGPEGLTRVVRRHGIKTIVNLRGRNADQAWYQAERAAARAAGATLIDLHMASDHWLSREQARTLVAALAESEPPVLVHCEWGAERTGLAACFAELLRPGGTLAAARAQFSLYYLFLPLRDGRVMLGHLDQYESWLTLCRVAHTPERFRLWLACGYVAGWPSREYWPCDPYPARIVNRPDGPVVIDPANPCPLQVGRDIRVDRR